MQKGTKLIKLLSLPVLLGTLLFLNSCEFIKEASEITFGDENDSTFPIPRMEPKINFNLKNSISLEIFESQEFAEVKKSLGLPDATTYEMFQKNPIEIPWDKIPTDIHKCGEEGEEKVPCTKLKIDEGEVVLLKNKIDDQEVYVIKVIIKQEVVKQEDTEEISKQAGGKILDAIRQINLRFYQLSLTDKNISDSSNLLLKICQNFYLKVGTPDSSEDKKLKLIRKRHLNSISPDSPRRFEIGPPLLGQIVDKIDNLEPAEIEVELQMELDEQDFNQLPQNMTFNLNIQPEVVISVAEAITS